MRSKLSKADITPVRQRSQYTCMAASLSMALKCHGQGHCDEDTVNKVMGAQPMRGASWEQALACAQHYGMRGTLTSPCTLKQLKAWTDAGVPVLIAWNPEGREWSHASLVFDVDDDENVHVADPNIPDPDETVRVVPKAEFYKKWYEKWPDYLVRRPAMAIEREITPDGRQVQASDREAKDKESVFMGLMQEFLKRKREKTLIDDLKKQKSDLEWRKSLKIPHPPSPSWKDLKESSTQPLMTRRDYGVTASMKSSDYAEILKYAVDLPDDVERYVEDIKKKNPEYSEGQAWATAWSIYCKYKNPGSEHCKQDASDYFPGRTAAGPYEIMYQVPGKGGFKTKAFKDQAAAEKWVEKFVEKEGDDVEVRWPAKTANMAGKKEQRSQKDKGMARFLKHGPVLPTEKSDAAKALDKAQWEARKEEGHAGLPGAGLGAGYHKDKSRYDRKRERSVDREAGSLTQPLRTRRDYGAVTASDYAFILKYAVNLPPEVEEDVKEIQKKNPDYTEGQA